MSRLLELNGKEFIEKVLSGERDFSKISLATQNVSGQAEYNDLIKYLKTTDLKNNPIILKNADISFVSFDRIFFPYSHFSGANMSGAYMGRADMRKANMEGANMSGADMRRVNMEGANMSGADIEETLMEGTNFEGANLEKTCLDPNAKPNGLVKKFKKDKSGRFIIGYRTKESRFIGSNIYESGKTYKAPVFSVSHEECHPGLYLFPTLKKLKKFLRPFSVYNENIVRVFAKASETHKAGDKYRCKEFYRVESL